MSNSGVNINCAKCCICFMAIAILLQGFAYLGFAITGLILRPYNNSTTLPTFIYFIHETSAKVFNPLAERPHIIAVAYAVVSSLWIITSIIIIGSLCATITKKVIAACFIPWFISIIIGCLVDAINTVFHVKHVLQTMDPKDIGILKSNNSTTLSDENQRCIILTVIVACITSRLIIIWLFNIVGSYCCLPLFRILNQRNQSSTKSSVANGDTVRTTSLMQTMIHKGTQCDEQLTKREERSERASINNVNQQQPDIEELKSLNIIQDIPKLKSTTNQLPVISENSQNSNKLHPNMLQQMLPSENVANDAEHHYNSKYYHHNLNQRVSVNKELRSQLPWSYINEPYTSPPKHSSTYPDIPVPDYNRN